MLSFSFDNTYARELPGCYVQCQPASVPAPRLLFLNEALAAELKLDTEALRGPVGAELFAGNVLPDGAEPIAQAYAGHQFGAFSLQLGDGRALLLGEVIDRAGRRRDIAFKGSGRTPFSRGGDGKAAVGPMLREVLIGEAMHALGIPTTRALAVVATGEPVYREQTLPGAVLTRVAASHLRIGTFQFFAARGDIEKLRQLAEYAIARHDPGLVGTPERYLALLRALAVRQAGLVAQWMNVGFIHGVMNTDNMAISGETIDYGPCAFMETYDPAAVFSSIDHGGRYAYTNQPGIARWNLARFAEALLPLIAGADDEASTQRAVAQVMEVIDAFPNLYAAAWRQGQRAKLGLYAANAADDATDFALADDWLAQLHAQSVDFTQAWRRLADAPNDDGAALRTLFAEPNALQGWLWRWSERCALDDAAGGTGAA
ncbi:MAG: YdiU family protein, partial [Burkholderiaceae bacterium]